MKVLLLKDIPKIGRRGEVKETNDGYARNFLIPNRLAEMATPEAIANLEKIKKVAIMEKEVRRDLLIKNIKELEGLVVVLKKTANEKGNLFSAIHPDEIAEVLEKKYRVSIAPENLVIDAPLKSLGTFSIGVTIGDIKGKFTLTIENTRA